MEIRHLKLIKAIVEEGSITKAIDKLHLTQSALSHQLKEAEFQLGTKIFLRQNKKLLLTKAGEKLYQTANEILHKLSDTEQQIKSLIFGETGEIRLSTECYSSYRWLPSVLKQFHQLYPRVELNLVVEATHYPLQKLLDNKLDIAIISDQIKNEQIAYTEIFQDELVMVVSQNHPWSDKKFVTARDFENEHLFIHSLPLETVTVYQSIIKPANVNLKKITPVPLTEACIELVKAEMGVMSMAKWAFQPYIKDNELRAVKIGKNGLKRKHFIAYLKHKTYPDYFFQFVDYLQTEINLQGTV